MSSFPTRTLLFGGIALALAGGTVFFGQSLLQARSEAVVQITPPAPASRPVLVASRLLMVGTSVKAGDFVWRDWPIAGIDPLYIIGPGQGLRRFDNNIIRREIQSGEPITTVRLAAPGSGGLAAATSPGQRAVSIALTPTTGVSGLIVPGDHVDVVLTYALPRPDAAAGGSIERRAATTILSDLKVLAVDQRLSGAPIESKDLRNASLEVTAKQSEVLALAADIGKLSLSLRSLGSEVGAVAPGSSSTMDYQVGRLLPGLLSRTDRRSSRAGAGTNPAVALTEFHGAKPSTASSTQ